ncbi:related to alcohol oxidase, partial [Phialocephala subalpina]
GGGGTAVIEAGPDPSEDFRVNTPAMWPSLGGSDKHLNGREVKHPQGRALGGSSAINAEAWIPPSAAVVDAWEQMGNPSWNWLTLAPYYRKSHTLVLLDAWTSTHLAWNDTFKTLNHEITGDPFSGQSTGGYSNPSSVDPASKTRSYSVSGYLKPVRKRGSLKAMTGTPAQRIVFEAAGENHTARGVEVLQDGKPIIITAKKEVILAAGCFRSPKLLELSGIGSSQLLGSLNVPLLVDNPNVGENLQDHLMTGISFEVKEGIEAKDPLIRQEPDAIQTALKMYAEEKKGQLCLAGIGSHGFMPLLDSESGDGKQEQDELIDQYISEGDDPVFKEHVRELAWQSSTTRELCDSWRHPNTPNVPWLGAPCFQRRLGPPKIGSNYLPHPLDLEVYARHILFLQTLAKTEPSASYLKPDGKRNYPTAFLKNLDDAKEYARPTSVPGYHYSGMCAILPRDKGGVVNERFLVHGTKNLRVVDASIMPLI